MKLHDLDTKCTYDFFHQLRNNANGEDPFFESEDCQLSYAELFRLADGVCAFLQRQGIRSGDRVVLALESDFHTVVIFVAAMWMGVTITLLDSSAPEQETKNIVELFDPNHLLLIPNWEVNWRFLTERQYQHKTILTIAMPLFDKISSEAKKLKPYAAPSRLWEDPMMVVFTSGTTGKPKGVVLSYRAILKQSFNMGGGIAFGQKSRILNLFRFYQIGGIVNGILLALLHGGTLYRPYENFSFSMGEALLKLLIKKPVSHFIFVPNVLSCLFRHRAAFKAAFSIADFKFFITTAAPIADDLWMQVEAFTNKVVINTFGSSEINNVTFTATAASKNRIGTIGQLFDTECKIIDNKGQTVPSGDTGELWMRGETSMSEYLKSPELTQQVIQEDGWVNTGDLAYERDGALVYVGRSVERIISGGHTIFPNEVTNALLSHPDIADAYTFGQAHGEWGELVACCIVAREPDLTTPVVVRFLREKLSPYKIPRKIVFVNSIPVTKRGKVRIQAVKELIS
ncbi:MAG: class I adenylate-forming enzyme family protein [Pseudomonadota bacterium]